MKRGRGRITQGEAMDKGVSNIQVTTEQLLVDAYDLAQPQTSHPTARPHRLLTDAVEINEYVERKRTEFEKSVTRQSGVVSVWLKYATWEAEQKEITRARRIYERMLEYHYGNKNAWLRYVEFEQRFGFVQSACNVLQRAARKLPKEETLWYKWALLEETAGRTAEIRTIFEEWIRTVPNVAHSVWENYAQSEIRAKDFDAARVVCSRFAMEKNDTGSWLYYARFEENRKEIERATSVYVTALQAMRSVDTELIIAYAEFATRHGKYDTARALLQSAVEGMTDLAAKAEVLDAVIQHERGHGHHTAVAAVIHERARMTYREKAAGAPFDYDAWLQWLLFEIRCCKSERTVVSDIFEKATTHAPAVQEKSAWARYIYIWLLHAAYLEVECADSPCAIQILQQCVKRIPHAKFSFSKVWIRLAEAQLRGGGGITEFRRTMGQALGNCPRPKVFRAYIATERILGETERIRKLYEKWLSIHPATVQPWQAYVGFECSLKEKGRAIALLEMALKTLSEAIDKNIIWDEYFAVHQDDVEASRSLYDRKAREEPTLVAAATLIEWAAYEEECAKDVPAAAAVLRQALLRLGEGHGGIQIAIRSFEARTQYEVPRGVLHAIPDITTAVSTTPAVSQGGVAEGAVTKKKLKLFDYAAKKAGT